jgi:hypothetical protein
LKDVVVDALQEISNAAFLSSFQAVGLIDESYLDSLWKTNWVRQLKLIDNTLHGDMILVY